MTSPNDNAPQDAELTPEARQILGRARRSFGISIAVLLVGFIAVAFALVYRATRDDGDAPYASIGSISLPAGAEVVQAVPAEGLIAVTYRVGGQTFLRLVDAKTGELAGEIGFVSAQ